MSSSFLKGELERELSELERRSNDGNNTKKKTVSKTKPLRENLSSKRHGIKKQLKTLKNKRQKPNPSKRYRFSLADETKSCGEKDKLSENLERLVSKTPTANPLLSDLAQQVYNSKKSYEPKGRSFFTKKAKKQHQESESVFTEADFEAFSKEYFIHSKPLSKV